MSTNHMSLNQSHLFSGSQTEEVAIAIVCSNTDNCFIEKDSSEESWIMYQRFGLRKAYVISTHHFTANTNEIDLSHLSTFLKHIQHMLKIWRGRKYSVYGTNELLQSVLWSPNMWASLPPVGKIQSHFFSKEKAQKSSLVSIQSQSLGFLHDL